MGFRDANIWKHSIFKQAGYLFSSQKRIQKCVFISETGVISLENLYLATGYCVNEAEKVAWMVIQKLKMPMEGVDELVLPISERSHMPLDPLGKLTKEEKEKLEPLKNIAKAKHAEVRSRVNDDQKKNANAELLKSLAYMAIIGAFLVAIVVLIKK